MFASTCERLTGTVGDVAATLRAPDIPWESSPIGNWAVARARRDAILEANLSP